MISKLHRQVLSIAVLAIVTGACGLFSVQTPTPVPTLAPTRTPNVKATEEKAREIYLVAVYESIERCTSIVRDDLGPVLLEASTDYFFLTNPSWKRTLNTILDDVEAYCVDVGYVNNPPADLKSMNEQLKLSSREFQKMVIYLRDGVERIDAEAIINAHLSMNAAWKYIMEADEELAKVLE